MEALAARGELEEVDLLLALAAHGQHLAEGVLLPAHRLDAVGLELHPVAQLARALGAPARLDLKMPSTHLKIALLSLMSSASCLGGAALSAVCV